MRGVLLAFALTGCSFHPGSLGGGGDADMMRPDLPDGLQLVTRRLVFDNSASAIEFIDLPVLVALDSSKIEYSLIKDPNSDLRFEDPATGKPVAFEIEAWNPGGESIVWIKVPDLMPHSTTTSVLMHYGPLAAGTPEPAFVNTLAQWELVNHMKPSLENAVGPKYAGTAIGVTQTDGYIGPAIGFSGVGDQRVTFTSSGDLFDGWGSFNLMFWLYVDYASGTTLGTTEPRVMEKGGSLGNGRVYGDAGSNIVFQVDFTFTGMNNIAYLNTVVPPKTWTFITYNYDRGTETLQVFNSGVQGGLYSMAGGQQEYLVNDVQPFYLGAATGSFVGRIDELRIEKRTRSPDYMRAQFLIMTRRFVTFTDP